MCIICIKPSGVSMPDGDTIQTMFINNPDGAGFMYVTNGEVKISKGYMKYKALKTALTELESKNDLFNIPFVLHCRIGTHGKNIPENTHPFPVTDSIGLLGKIKTKTSLAIAHNGIIDAVTPRKNISDTMEYVASQLSPLYKLRRDFYLTLEGRQLVFNAIQSKMVFLDSDGNIQTVGEFKDVNGLLYSNTSYEEHVYYQKWNYYFDWSANGYKTDVRAMMWLNDDDGYVILENGEIVDGGDYLIGRDMKVYRPDYYNDGVIEVSNAQAFTDAGQYVEFDTDKAEYLEVMTEYKSRIPMTSRFKPTKKAKGTV